MLSDNWTQELFLFNLLETSEFWLPVTCFGIDIRLIIHDCMWVM